MFNWVDYAILGIIIFSLLISFIRGFVREALSLFTWAAAIWLAIHFFEALSSLLESSIHSPSLRNIASFGLLFIGTLILGAMVNYLIAQLVDRTGLSGTDRILGVLFGGVRGVLMVTILLMLTQLTSFPQEPWWQASVLIPHFHPMEVWLHDFLPASVYEHMQLDSKQS